MEKKICKTELIPNGLKIALCIGMLSGVVTAIILADIRNNQGIEYVEGPSLTVLAEKSDYKKGEMVRIILVNSGSVPLFFPDGTYGLKVTGLAGMPIFLPETDDAAVLMPKDEHVIFWNQKNNDGSQVFDGIYKISVHGFDDSGVWTGDTETINVIEIDLTFGS